MGIELPVVTTVFQQHHRNRSLDAELHRIPEISPEGECLCITPIVQTAVSAVHRQHHPSSKIQREELASLGSDDSGILCGSDTGSTDTTATRESSVDYLDSGSETDLRTQVTTITTTTAPVCQSNTEVVNITTTNRVTQVNVLCEIPKPSTGLLRLLESEVCDVSIAVLYLFNSKEPGVQSYIANKMFSFDDVTVDFYLPQLVCMYIQMQDVAEVLHPYFLYR